MPFRRRLRALSASALASLVLVSLLLGEPVATDAWASRGAGVDASGACDLGCPGVVTGPGAYVGSLLLPPASGASPASLRGAAAHCDGCVWWLEPACQRPDLGGAMCAGAA